MRLPLVALVTQLLAISFCGFQCDPGAAREIASLSGKANGKRLDDRALKGVFEEVTARIRADGFYGPLGDC